MKKRILAVLLSSAIVFSGMPINVLADEEVTFEEGVEEGVYDSADITEEVVEEPEETVIDSAIEVGQDEADIVDGENEITAEEIDSFDIGAELTSGANEGENVVMILHIQSLEMKVLVVH